MKYSSYRVKENHPCPDCTGTTTAQFLLTGSSTLQSCRLYLRVQRSLGRWEKAQPWPAECSAGFHLSEQMPISSQGQSRSGVSNVPSVIPSSVTLSKDTLKKEGNQGKRLRHHLVCGPNRPLQLCLVMTLSLSRGQ